MTIKRRDLLIAGAGLMAAPVLPARAAAAQTLRIGMTAADLPSTHGIPNNGFEGYRFLGYPPYDGLVNWDLRDNLGKPAEITPGLFTEWRSDTPHPSRWAFTVRPGVKFHDGSDLYYDKSPQYDATAAPIVRAAVSMVAAFEKADDNTVVMTTKYPFSFRSGRTRCSRPATGRTSRCARKS